LLLEKIGCASYVCLVLVDDMVKVLQHERCCADGIEEVDGARQQWVSYLPGVGWIWLCKTYGGTGSGIR